MVGIDGLQAGDAVTAEQMRALFGAGMHPLAAQRLEQLPDADLTDDNIRAATWLGAPFNIRTPSPIDSRSRLPAGWLRYRAGDFLAADWRDMRAEVAREFFQTEHGRRPTDVRELAAAIAKLSRPPAQPVAGYDLTFSPVNRVNLWAVADPHIAALIERAHQAAVRDALIFIEKHALFTREGPQGLRQVNVQVWSRQRSRIATAARVIPICTPMSPSPTRSKPLTGDGCRSTGGCCSKPPWPHRKPTTPPSNTTCKIS